MIIKRIPIIEKLSSLSQIGLVRIIKSNFNRVPIFNIFIVDPIDTKIRMILIYQEHRKS